MEKSDANLFEKQSISKTENPKQNLYFQIKKECITAGQNTTAHGIPSILRNEKLALKIIWIILFLTSSAYCLHLVIQSALNYLEYPVVTQIKTVTEIPSKFPMVKRDHQNLNTFFSYLNIVS
jgi:hypothetical protein